MVPRALILVIGCGRCNTAIYRASRSAEAINKVEVVCLQGWWSIEWWALITNYCVSPQFLEFVMFWCSLLVDFSIELMHLGLVFEGEVVLVPKSSSASGSNVHRAQILLRARSTLVSNLVFFIIQSRKTSIMTKDVTCFVDPLYIHRQTCYLFGRERRVADIPTDHPSCSKQHAVIQYR